ncbi:MAG: hypothetical protein VKP72_13520 [bacterium]|nr:hypothetical protein [bacterium]
MATDFKIYLEETEAPGFLESVRQYITTFRSDDAVSLLIRPQVGPETCLERILELLTGMGMSPEATPDMEILGDPDLRELALIRQANLVIGPADLLHRAAVAGTQVSPVFDPVLVRSLFQEFPREIKPLSPERPVIDSDLPSTPHMDDEGLACFTRFISGATCYLEYGSGGSTVMAARTSSVRTIITVESHPEWASRISRGIRTPDGKLHVEYCNIGPVKDWGVPATMEMAATFHHYMTKPWDRARSLQEKPDLVLIDGRFRVASFLYSLISAEIGTPILFDDFIDRPEYHVVLDFCEMTEKHGRMAVFHAHRELNLPEFSKTLARYTLDYE